MICCTGSSKLRHLLPQERSCYHGLGCGKAVCPGWCLLQKMVQDLFNDAQVSFVHAFHQTCAITRSLYGCRTLVNIMLCGHRSILASQHCLICDFCLKRSQPMCIHFCSRLLAAQCPTQNVCRIERCVQVCVSVAAPPIGSDASKTHPSGSFRPQ